MKREPTEEKFLADVAEHQMIVLRDDGINRHIRFKRPGTSCMHFDLITWPGRLCYTGDMDTYVFARLEDMFEFFRTDRHYKSSGEKRLHINLGYWAEKVIAAGRDGIQEYDADKFRALIEEWLARRDEVSPELRDLVDEEVLSQADNGEYAALNAAMELCEDDEQVFPDFWECNLKEYTFRFIWCCYALAWGIEQYDNSKETAQ